MERLFKHTLALLIACAALQAQAAIVVDGEIGDAEWEGAQHFADFRETQPLSGSPAPADLHTEAWLKSTPEGIAVAIRALQPMTVARTAPRVQRDFDAQVDRVNFMVNFNADGGNGFDFTVSASNDISDETIAQENQFNKDWDGNWQHAVKTDEAGYHYEMLVPWHIASMKPGADGRRRIAVYFDRVIAATGQRFATPSASFTRPRFVSDFQSIEVDDHPASLLAITPYVVTSADLKHSSQDIKAGADLFWKPNGNHQFAATLHPDFGQVESDQLVVNFDAIETFYTDKRPFFTENQAAFQSSWPGGDLFYTRRVGSTADDGSGAGEIKAAVKGNGRFGDFGYGFFAADESGDAGRSFYLARGSHQSPKHELSLLQTHVDRPFLDRTADVSAINSRWKPNAEWLINTAVHASDVAVGDQHQRGLGGGVVADWDMPGPWRQQYYFTRVDKDVNVNDLGFQDRNNFRLFEWESGYRQDQLPADSMFSSHSWEYELVSLHNLEGFRLRDSATVQRYSETRDGGNMFGFLRYGLDPFDDLISRGNGPIRINGGWSMFFERFKPRQENSLVDWYANIEAFPLRAASGYGFSGGLQPKFHPSDTLDVDIGLFAAHQSDWLVWQQGSEFGSFRQKRLDLTSNLNWFINDKQELRLKLQSIAIDARAKQARRIGADHHLVDSTGTIDDFNVRNFGFQLRYRYKLGALSDVFAVYSRGGFALDEQRGEAMDLLGDSFSLRDDDQFLVKVAYRFEP
jgi:hypothetical protein